MHMKSKLLNLGLILSSLVGYLEWGGNNSMFLFQGELEVIAKLFTDFGATAHPFTLLPLLGQLLLAFTLLQKSPSRMLTFLGLAGVGLLLAFMFIIGVLGLNFKIALSVVPFLALAFITVKHHRAKKSATTI